MRVSSNKYPCATKFLNNFAFWIKSCGAPNPKSAFAKVECPFLYFTADLVQYISPSNTNKYLCNESEIVPDRKVKSEIVCGSKITLIFLFFSKKSATPLPHFFPNHIHKITLSISAILIRISGAFQIRAVTIIE